MRKLSDFDIRSGADCQLIQDHDILQLLDEHDFRWVEAWKTVVRSCKMKTEIVSKTAVEPILSKA
jgi:hypothetical protein